MRTSFYGKIPRAGLLTACLALLMGLCCCSQQRSGPPPKTLLLHFDAVDTDILLMENGALSPLDEEAKEALCGRSESLVIQELALDALPEDVRFSLSEVSLSYRPALRQRLTALFDGAAYLQAGHVSFERQVVCDPQVPAKAQNAVLDAIEAVYVLPEPCVSADLADPGLSVPGAGRYAAVIFIPRVYTIRGIFIIGPDRYPIEIVYPCSNILDVMDGIYYVQEGDAPEAFP